MKNTEEHKALFAEVPSSKFRGYDDGKKICSCLKTTDKIRKILSTFPAPTPPTMKYKSVPVTKLEDLCISPYCVNPHNPSDDGTCQTDIDIKMCTVCTENSRFRVVVMELVKLVQVSVTAAAIGIYYILYAYMQLIYFTLRSALFFHHADGSMKITIGVVTVTALVIFVNLLQRIEKLIKLNRL